VKLRPSARTYSDGPDFTDCHRHLDRLANWASVTEEPPNPARKPAGARLMCRGNELGVSIEGHGVGG
jgi:hypothetical protein